MALKKSFIVLILCLALLSAALAACSNGGEESAVPSGTQSDLSGTAADAFPYEGNFEGQTVRILTVSSDRHLYGNSSLSPMKSCPAMSSMMPWRSETI